METTVQRGTEPVDSRSIEETQYGSPQHTTRGNDPEQTFYGVPQHQTDAVVNVEPWEFPTDRYREGREEVSVRFDRPRHIHTRTTGVSYP